jgi:hypothetical protein
MNKKTKYFVETGQRFGRLIVIREFAIIDKRGYKERRVACLCECGNLMDCKINSLFKNTKSCGCLRRENSANLLRIHGKYYDPVFSVFKSMRARCYNKNKIDYNRYGGRGIRICGLWLNHPEAFVEWAYRNGYKNGLTIERINNNEGYSPSNCIFTGRVRQANNRRTNRIIDIGGEKMSMADFCRKHNINYEMFRQRINQAGKPPQEAMINCGQYKPMNKTERAESLYVKL